MTTEQTNRFGYKLLIACCVVLAIAGVLGLLTG